uniref:Uncharacterized protein n=1 Tax=Amazona collaria TaxID=241587 RepID=A0A8B9F1A3_9PSIT
MSGNWVSANQTSTNVGKVEPLMTSNIDIWYDVKAPAMFNIRNIGKTLVTRTQGTKIASDGLKGRVFEVMYSYPGLSVAE